MYIHIYTYTDKHMHTTTGTDKWRKAGGQKKKKETDRQTEDRLRTDVAKSHWVFALAFRCPMVN